MIAWVLLTEESLRRLKIMLKFQHMERFDRSVDKFLQIRKKNFIQDESWNIHQSPNIGSVCFYIFTSVKKIFSYLNQRRHFFHRRSVLF